MQQGWFAKVIKDKFNVELNIIDNADGTFATRLESKDLGNTLYQRGLVDPDSMTQTFDDCYADYKDGAADFFAVALLIAAAVYVIALTYVFACAVAFVLRSRLVHHRDFREARGTACPA